MDGIIGLLPDPWRIALIDYGVLREVVAYIMSSPVAAVPTRFGDLPELGEKIKLNKLCSVWGDSDPEGSATVRTRGPILLKELELCEAVLYRDHLVEIYQRARDVGRGLCWLSPKESTERISSLMTSAGCCFPGKPSRAAEDAVEILIGYYYQTCACL